MELPYGPAIPLSGEYTPEGVENRCSNKNLYQDFFFCSATLKSCDHSVWMSRPTGGGGGRVLASMMLGPEGGERGFVGRVQGLPWSCSVDKV